MVYREPIGSAMRKMDPFRGEHGDGPVVLEERRGERWVVIGRYETAARAAAALDERIGEGARSSDLRITPAPDAQQQD